MTEPNDVQSSLDRMKIHMELRGLRPNTVSTFARCARRFLAHTDKSPADVTSADVESFLLDLGRKGRSPRTRNVNLAAVRCLLAATTGGNATAGIRAQRFHAGPRKFSAAPRSPSCSPLPTPPNIAPSSCSPTVPACASVRSRRCSRGYRQQAHADPCARGQDRAPPRDAEPARSRGAARLLEAARPKGPSLFPGR